MITPKMPLYNATYGTPYQFGHGKADDLRLGASESGIY
jgi:hypothetical protein